MAPTPKVEGLMKKLEYLSLVSKVRTELETHLGLDQRVLAEFITELGRNCETVDKFDSKLKENGAEMPDYLVRTLLTIIRAILPSKPKSEKESNKESASDGRKGKYSTLAIADNGGRAKEIEREIEIETLEHRRHTKDREEEEDGGHRRRDKDRSSDWDRVRRDRHRNRCNREERRGDRDINEDEADRTMERHEDRHDKQRRDKEDVDDRGRNQRHQSEEPVLYKVYKGKVSRVMDSGCFVQLNDLKGKEGLVHVSQMVTRRSSNAKNVVKRDQDVYVKVISVSGQRLSLSMRDVDQNTGKDLLPLKKSSEDDIVRANPSSRSKKGLVMRTGLSGIRILEDNAVPSRRPLKRIRDEDELNRKVGNKAVDRCGCFKC